MTLAVCLSRILCLFSFPSTFLRRTSILRVATVLAVGSRALIEYFDVVRKEGVRVVCIGMERRTVRLGSMGQAEL